MSIKSVGYSRDTIVAIATPAGSGAISVIRLSGSESLSLCMQHFKPTNKKLSIANIESHKLYLGYFVEDKILLMKY